VAPRAWAQEDLPGWLRTDPSDTLLAGLRQRVEAGLTPAALHEAFTLATAQAIDAGHGLSRAFDLVIAVDPVARASTAVSSELTWWPWVWLLDAWSEGRSEDPLPPAPKVPGRQRGLPTMLQTALDDWDKALADTLVTAWCRTQDPRQAFDLLAVQAARDAPYVGRKAEYLAAAWRNLETVGFWHAETVLRSAVRALLVREQPPGTRYQGGLEQAVEAVSQPTSRPTSGPSDERQVQQTLEVLATASPLEVQQMLARDRAAGLPAGPSWVALHVGAARLTRERPTHVVGRRAVSTVQALHALASRATEARTRGVLLLRAGWRLAFFRDQAISDGTVIDLGPAVPPLPAPRPGPTLERLGRGPRDAKDYICTVAALDAAESLEAPWSTECLAAAAPGFPEDPSTRLAKMAKGFPGR